MKKIFIMTFFGIILSINSVSTLSVSGKELNFKLTKQVVSNEANFLDTYEIKTLEKLMRKQLVNDKLTNNDISKIEALLSRSMDLRTELKKNLPNDEKNKIQENFLSIKTEFENILNDINEKPTSAKVTPNPVNSLKPEHKEIYTKIQKEILELRKKLRDASTEQEKKEIRQKIKDKMMEFKEKTGEDYPLPKPKAKKIPSKPENKENLPNPMDTPNQTQSKIDNLRFLSGKEYFYNMFTDNDVKFNKKSTIINPLTTTPRDTQVFNDKSIEISYQKISNPKEFYKEILMDKFDTNIKNSADSDPSKPSNMTNNSDEFYLYNKSDTLMQISQNEYDKFED